MLSITYFIRFTLRNPKPGMPYEEQEHLHLADAFESFRGSSLSRTAAGCTAGLS